MTTVSGLGPRVFKISLLVFCAAWALTASGCASSAGKFNFNPAHSQYQLSDDYNITPRQREVNSILKTAFSMVGTPYRYGGTSPQTGFDCSGYVQWVYNQYGIPLPRSSRDMAQVGVPVSREELRPGDLVFFGHKKRISHVGIYTGNDKYIHSPRTGKSIVETTLDNAYGRKYTTARRILNNEGTRAIDESLKRAWVDESRRQLAASRTPDSVKDALPRAGAQKASNKKKAARTASSQSSKAAAIQHTVQSGDTIYDLARHYGVSQKDLLKANQLNRKKALQLGQILVVPVKN